MFQRAAAAEWILTEHLQKVANGKKTQSFSFSFFAAFSNLITSKGPVQQKNCANVLFKSYFNQELTITSKALIRQ